MNIFCKSREALIRERIDKLNKLRDREALNIVYEYRNTDMTFEQVCASTCKINSTTRAINRMYKLIQKR